MKYQKASAVLPEQLLIEVQKYIQGEFLYIPNLKGVKKNWGERSGSREFLKTRNQKIRNEFSSGVTIDQLSKDFCLSIDSIKKIVYKKEK